MSASGKKSELVILIGLPGAGKTTFYHAHLAATHSHVSKDLMRNRRDRQERQMAMIEAALALGQSVVVDNVNATIADRAPLIAAGRKHGARIVGYALATPADVCTERNRGRSGPSRVPVVAIRTAAKRFEPATYDEGYDELHRVETNGGGFVSSLLSSTERVAMATIFLLSPASTSGERAAMLMNPTAEFPLAQQVRSEHGAPLGDIFSFCSSLYFRGKLTYARAFGRPPAGLCEAFVITPGEGLRDPAEPVTIARLRRYDAIRIKTSEKRYLEPLMRDAAALASGGR